MFRRFLRESSLHGLRYLADDDDDAGERSPPLSKVVWLSCILTCGASAAVFIYFNVEDWRNSPTVVTSVKPALVEDEPWMPMLTVCPRQPDLNTLLLNVLERYPEVITEEMARELEGALVAVSMDLLSVSAVGVPIRVDTFDFFDQCTGEETDEAGSRSGEPSLVGREECELAAVLWQLADNKLPRYRGRNVVRKYLLEVWARDSEPTLTGLRETAAVEGVAMTDNFTEVPQLTHFQQRKQYGEALSLYRHFFEIFTPDGEFQPLRKIGEYRGPEIRVTRETFAASLAHLADLNHLGYHNEGLAAMACRAVAAGLAAHLEVNLQEEEDGLFRMLQMLDTFALAADRRIFYLKSAQVSNPCPNVTNVASFCRDDDAASSLTPECVAYCDVVGYSFDKDKVGEVYEMATARAGGGGLSGVLPSCRKGGDGPLRTDCWEEILTEKGVCYSSSIDSDWLSVKTGEYAAVTYATDRGGFLSTLSFAKAVLGVDDYDSDLVSDQTFDVRFGQAGHHALDRLEEEERVTRTYKASKMRGGAGAWMWSAKVAVDRVTGGTSTFRDLSPARRGCLYSTEKTLPHFPTYSESNCMLECAWERARDACGCVPWHLLRYFGQDDLCELQGNACHQQVLNDRYRNKGACEAACLPDCERVEYVVEVDEDDWRHGDLAEELETHAKGLKDAVWPEESKNISTYMGTMSPNVGFVRVFVSQKVTLAIAQAATVTAIDMVSNVGGTLGLFCGFSLLSAVEVLHWAAKAVTTTAKKRDSDKR